MKNSRTFWFALAAIAIGGCATPPVPIPVTPPGEAATAPVVRRTLPEPAPPPVVASIAPAEPRAPALAPVVVPADAIYVCVSETGGERKQTAIEFVSKVESLCRRHPPPESSPLW